MNPFVDPKKRDFLLPDGMKDLLAVIPPKANATSQTAEPSPKKVATCSYQKNTISLTQLESEMQAFQRPGSQHRLFVVESSKAGLQLRFYRNNEALFSGSLIFDDDPERESRFLEILTSLGLKFPQHQSPGFIPKIPGIAVQTIWDLSPLPQSATELAHIVRIFFLTGGELPPDAEVQCIRVEQS